MLEREENNITYLLNEVENWKNENIITEDQFNSISEKYTSHISSIKEKKSGKDKLFLSESLPKWLIRIAVLTILTSFAIIAGVHLFSLTPFQKIILSYLAGAAFLYAGMYLRHKLTESIANSMLFIGCSLITTSTVFLYEDYYSIIESPVLELILLCCSAVLTLYMSHKFNSETILLLGFSNVIGICFFLVSELSFTPNIMSLFTFFLALVGLRYSLTRGAASVTYNLIVLLFSFLIFNATQFSMGLTVFSLILILSTLIFITGHYVMKYYKENIPMAFYLTGFLSFIISFSFWFQKIKKSFFSVDYLGDILFIDVVVYFIIGSSVLYYGTKIMKYYLIAAGGIVLLIDVHLFSEYIELNLIMKAIILLIIGIIGIFAAMTYEKKQKAILSDLGVAKRDDDKGSVTEGAVESLGEILE